MLTIIPSLAQEEQEVNARVRPQHPSPNGTLAAALAPPAVCSRLAVQHGDICVPWCQA